MDEMDHLADERNRAEFDVEAMKVVWAGSERALRLSDRMARLVASDPVFRKDNKPMMSRKELFKNGMRKAAHAWKRINELCLSEEEASQFRSFIDEPSVVDAHWAMFVSTIREQGTKEQQQKWLPLAHKLQIIGCYAQTELGHGSNVRGIETTATFDPKSDKFIINSPTLTSTKWWPGGLGKASTHAVVYARLVLNSEDHGVHGFIVQLRSLDDHLPLPGITVGDIGMKFGNGAYNTVDNGLLRFDNVCIPRNQMLMGFLHMWQDDNKHFFNRYDQFKLIRFSQVTRDGKYTQSNVPRQLAYGAMVYVRKTIVSDASIALSRAVCIATRYGAIRRQFGSQEGGSENQIIDYKTQQSRLFPLLATAYAFRFVGEWLNWLYMDVTQRIKANDFSTLPEAHACTAGLKSLTTSITANGIEECRKLCGGHGYLLSSGLPQLFATYVPACTYEGDNYVMLLQVARFLMKTISKLGSTEKLVGTTAYMQRVKHLMHCHCNVQEAKDWLKPSVILEAFEARAMRMSMVCSQNISKMPNKEEGLAEFSSDLVEMATAHCQLIVVSKFIEKLQEAMPGKGVKNQLEVLFNIYSLSLLHSHQGDFLATASITSKQASLANDQLRHLYTQVRPNAIALVDAFNHTDHYLGSVLGCYNGNVYPKLYEEAWKDPLNDCIVPDGYHEYLRPLLKQQLHNARL